MKRLVILLLLNIVSIMLAQNSTPKITANVTNYDFGTITEGEVVSHNFEIQNTGNADLKISNVQVSCGCTAAKPEKTELKPGEKTLIKVEFNSEARLGPQEKFVYITSNDASSSPFKLSFTGVVVDKSASVSKDGKNPKLKLSIVQHDFGTVEEGKIVQATISFKNEGKGVLQINEVKTSCGCTAALLSSKTLKPGESGNVKIELDTSNREGKLTRTVTLYTNDPQQPNQTIILFVNIEKRKS